MWIISENLISNVKKPEKVYKVDDFFKPLVLHYTIIGEDDEETEKKILISKVIFEMAYSHYLTQEEIDELCVHFKKNYESEISFADTAVMTSAVKQNLIENNLN